MDGVPVMGKHAETHLEGAFDPVYIWMSQVLNLRVVAAGEFKVQIWQGRQYGEDGWKSPARSAAWNLESYQPGSGAKWLLVYLQRDGTFTLIEGETADSIALLTPALIPALPFGGWGVAAVRLYAGQSAISGIKDIYDLRWAAMPFNAASGISEVTISSGEITALSSFISIFGEGEAADDLDTINGGAHGSMITLVAPNGDTAAVTVKDSTGNIDIDGDYELSDASKAITLIYDDEQDLWISPFSASKTGQALFTVEGSLSIGAKNIRLPNMTGRTLTISKVYLIVGTEPDGDDLICDIHKNGTTIFTTQSNRPTITDGNSEGSTTTIEVPSWADGEYLTLEIDQVGSGTAGADLTVAIVYS
jgi:hypothetical protein